MPVAQGPPAQVLPAADVAQRRHHAACSLTDRSGDWPGFGRGMSDGHARSDGQWSENHWSAWLKLLTVRPAPLLIFWRRAPWLKISVDIRASDKLRDFPYIAASLEICVIFNITVFFLKVPISRVSWEDLPQKSIPGKSPGQACGGCRAASSSCGLLLDGSVGGLARFRARNVRRPFKIGRPVVREPNQDSISTGDS